MQPFRRITQSTSQETSFSKFKEQFLFKILSKQQDQTSRWRRPANALPRCLSGNPQKTNRAASSACCRLLAAPMVPNPVGDAAFVT